MQISWQSPFLSVVKYLTVSSDGVMRGKGLAFWKLQISTSGEYGSIAIIF